VAGRHVPYPPLLSRRISDKASNGNGYRSPNKRRRPRATARLQVYLNTYPLRMARVYIGAVRLLARSPGLSQQSPELLPPPGYAGKAGIWDFRRSVHSHRSGRTLSPPARRSPLAVSRRDSSPALRARILKEMRRNRTGAGEGADGARCRDTDETPAKPPHGRPRAILNGATRGRIYAVARA